MPSGTIFHQRPSQSTQLHNRPEHPDPRLQEEQYETSVPAVRDRIVQAALKIVLEPDDVGSAGIDLWCAEVVGDLIVETGGVDGVGSVDGDEILHTGHSEAHAVASDRDCVGMPLTLTAPSLQAIVLFSPTPETLSGTPCNAVADPPPEVLGCAPGALSIDPPPPVTVGWLRGALVDIFTK